MAGGHSEILPARRDQALAFIIKRIARTGISPTFEEIAISLGVSVSRAKQLVDQLVKRGAIEKTPGTQRNLRVRDVTHSREVLDQALRRLGWAVSEPMSVLAGGFPKGQLPILPPFEHHPDVD